MIGTSPLSVLLLLRSQYPMVCISSLALFYFLASLTLCVLNSAYRSRRLNSAGTCACSHQTPLAVLGRSFATARAKTSTSPSELVSSTRIPPRLGSRGRGTPATLQQAAAAPVQTRSPHRAGPAQIREIFPAWLIFRTAARWKTASKWDTFQVRYSVSNHRAKTKLAPAAFFSSKRLFRFLYPPQKKGKLLTLLCATFFLGGVG